MTQGPIVTLGLILMTACLVAMLTRRLHLPYSIGLVAAGAGLGLLPQVVDLPLSRDLVFTVFLPPLIFEAALHLEWPAFRRELPATLLLAFPGVILAAGAVALGVHLLLGWSWIGGSLFGVLIAATDPVSVIAAFKEMKVEPRLALIVESESLLNDGAAAVGFGVLTTIAAGGSSSVLAIAGSLLWTIVGSVAVGGAVAFVLLQFAGRTVDHLVEMTLTTIAAYGSFLLAEHFGMSGVLGSLAAGLVVGNVGWTGPISESSRDYVISFWEYAAFLANSIIFILIGGREAQQPLDRVAGAAVVAILLVLIGRALAVYSLSLLLVRTPLRLTARYQHVLFWGGLRGALALALALALPATIAERHEIIVVAFAVVAFSIFVQGLTMPVLVRSLGFMAKPSPAPPVDTP